MNGQPQYGGQKPNPPGPKRLGEILEDLFYFVGNTAGWAVFAQLALLLGVAFWLFAIKRPFHMIPMSEADQAAVERQEGWTAAVEETFTGGTIHSDVDWPHGPETGDFFRAERTFVDECYLWHIDFFAIPAECCRSFTLAFLPDLTVDDFLLTVDFTKHSGDDGIQYGVVYHYVDLDNFYIFDMNDIGNMGTAVWHQGEWKAIFTPSFRHSPIRAYSTNRLTLSVESGHALVFINDEYVGQYDDNRVPSGKLGFVVSPPYEDVGTIDISIDNVVLRTPN